ncbi:(2Fe-2S)-binding protein [bacterium]|nr:(2Fe-2S)-binding protein [candidate division CSSED10-310 bacterium]
MKLEVTINNQKHTLDIHPGDRLLDVLRRDGFTGVKEGCGDGNCGACVVLLNGNPVNSCLILAARVQHQQITTIEGIGNPQKPHPIQIAFADKGAVQCGFSTPGSILSTFSLLQKNPKPTDQEIRRALDGNLCRCTGYVKKIEAIKSLLND